MDLLIGAAVLFIVIYVTLIVLRFIGRILSFDVFGVYYDDPTSPYYHDRHGKGRGHRDR